MIEIDQFIPIPEERRGPPLKYPWDTLKVGESFLVKCAKSKRYKKQHSLLTSARLWRKRNCKTRKFRTRMVENGVRVWRKK